MKRLFVVMLLALFALTIEQTAAGPPINLGTQHELVLIQYSPAMQTSVLQPNLLLMSTPAQSAIVEVKEASPLLIRITNTNLYANFNSVNLCLSQPPAINKGKPRLMLKKLHV